MYCCFPEFSLCWLLKIQGNNNAKFWKLRNFWYSSENRNFLRKMGKMVNFPLQILVPKRMMHLWSVWTLHMVVIQGRNVVLKKSNFWKKWCPFWGLCWLLRKGPQFFLSILTWGIHFWRQNCKISAKTGRKTPPKTAVFCTKSQIFASVFSTLKRRLSTKVY